ncbi:hypothetical protein [Aquabacterium sp.]|uniref:hypothetical protein n=1 Tax=Aquabacterium sp. TaxID=1872578 RepID=UPI00199E6D7B|nr:hypothetical protein [Aquabacterium sp.]MBC7701313.1 hypothetical protein [Aquabacterium sp.]
MLPVPALLVGQRHQIGLYEYFGAAFSAPSLWKNVYKPSHERKKGEFQSLAVNLIVKHMVAP